MGKFLNLKRYFSNFWISSIIGLMFMFGFLIVNDTFYPKAIILGLIYIGLSLFFHLFIFLPHIFLNEKITKIPFVSLTLSFLPVLLSFVVGFLFLGLNLNDISNEEQKINLVIIISNLAVCLVSFQKNSFSFFH